MCSRKTLWTLCAALGVTLCARAGAHPFPTEELGRFSELFVRCDGVDIKYTVSLTQLLAIEEIALNVLQEQITALEEEGRGRDAAVAVSMLIEACRMGLQSYTGQLLVLIDEQIAEEPHFVSAFQAANQLLLLWQARDPLEARDLKEIPDLLRSAYLRGVT